MAAPSQLLSRSDLDFLLHDWLDVTALTARPRFAEHSRETVDAVLDVCAEIAAERFRPHNKRNDAEEPRFVDGRVEMHPEVAPALAALAGTGLLGATADADAGGLQLPQVVHTACSAWFAAANISTFAYAMLTTANANLLLAHGSPEQVDTWVRPMLEGRFHGTMCLSETQAGSSLADITTRAEPRGDGTYRITGTKMWISGGDHELGENIVHLVLAKIPGGPAGVKGISLFVVPKFLPDGDRNDVVLAGLNHKMGYRGTTNTVLNFGEGAHTPGGEPGAVGHLVGEPHTGLAQMFHMMNEARVGVGAGAVALGYTGQLAAVEYARSRPQGRPVDAKDPAAPQVPIVDHADVRRMLLAGKSYVEGGLGLVLYCGRLLDDQRTAEDPADRERAGLLLDVLTPIAKSWPSQWCLAANDLAIQVHGGYGYTREYDVEQHYRDNRLNPIHEGTHGIQGLDLLGRKLAMRGAAGLDALDAVLAATVARGRAAGGEAAEHADALDAARVRMVEVTRALHAEPDVAARLANASVHLEATGHVVVAWVWLEQLLAAAGRDDDLGRGKRAAARYFFRYELPRTGPWFDLLASLDRTTVDLDPAWL
ncbi:acyl-CoA dehydrogenase [Pseudonocardia sp. Ae505_Ps2]|uniref:acyl-CoA dehydrogenase n=1 Tax=Pseudonocardia sp. Ae505_Ps2 TaxID=1885034 RepID=UPI00094E460A|nr:acyl-CoA dehydrogenase [Pseudonocardia sp. Ae505_Ps2]OLM10067.1 3-methylmercaptopropionyl-CoA dehydrogenase (DmdC) [Pseudonocardia sp. Ae505_Ps2]